MEFNEIYNYLKEGKKVKKRKWNSSDYIYIDTSKYSIHNTDILDQDGNDYIIGTIDLECKTWVLLREDELWCIKQFYSNDDTIAFKNIKTLKDKTIQDLKELVINSNNKFDNDDYYEVEKIIKMRFGF